jgi:hypothetical protein
MRSPSGRAVDPERVPRPDRSARGDPPSTGGPRVRRALPWRAKPRGSGEPADRAETRSREQQWHGCPARTSRRAAELLRPPLDHVPGAGDQRRTWVRMKSTIGPEPGPCATTGSRPTGPASRCAPTGCAGAFWAWGNGRRGVPGEVLGDSLGPSPAITERGRFLLGDLAGCVSDCSGESGPGAVYFRHRIPIASRQVAGGPGRGEGAVTLPVMDRYKDLSGGFS